jgi:hypothetical protein
VALILESGAQANLDDRKISLCQQFLGAFYPLPHQILLWRDAGALSKGTSEVKLTQTRGGGNLRQAKIFFQIRIYKFLYAAKLISRQATTRRRDKLARSSVVRKQMQR